MSHILLQILDETRPWPPKVQIKLPKMHWLVVGKKRYKSYNHTRRFQLSEISQTFPTPI